MVCGGSRLWKSGDLVLSWCLEFVKQPRRRGPEIAGADPIMEYGEAEHVENGGKGGWFWSFAGHDGGYGSHVGPAQLRRKQAA